MLCTIKELIDLYTPPLREDEMVLTLGEKTSLQPRPGSPRHCQLSRRIFLTATSMSTSTVERSIYQERG